MRNFRFLIGFALIISLILPLASANAGGDDQPYTITSVPREMSYQGILRDSAGDPVEDSVYSITFRIFNVASGGTSMWDETLPCTTSAGLFNATFSNVNLPFLEDYWLEIEIDSEILDPRQKLSMVGYAAASDTADYAQRVATVDGATGGTISGNVNIQSDLAVDGNINATGKATIGPGHTNSGIYAFVAGENNTASGHVSTIGGGAENYANGENSVIGGGYTDSVYAHFGGVLSGWSNSAGNDHEDTAAFVGGGFENSAVEKYSTVVGGQYNTASGVESTVGGGSHNTASGLQSTIAGGYAGTASDENATIGGGWHNVASGLVSTVAGGQEDTADGTFSSISGGREMLPATTEAPSVGGSLIKPKVTLRQFLEGGVTNLPAIMLL